MYQPTHKIYFNKHWFNVAVKVNARSKTEGYMLQHNIPNFGTNNGLTGSGFRMAERLNCYSYESAEKAAFELCQSYGAIMRVIDRTTEPITPVIIEQPTPIETTPVEPTPVDVEQTTTDVEQTTAVVCESVADSAEQAAVSATIVDVESLIKSEVSKQLAAFFTTEQTTEQPIKEPTTESYAITKALVQNGQNVYLYGPAGCGKNYMCELLAKSLNLDFYFTNCITDETQLIGYRNINGDYVETEFYKAYKNGGLFMLDEIDASVPECTTVLNSALANGYFPFPNGTIKQHNEFRIVAAGNTVGLGATEQYTTRNVLSAEFRDRFQFIEVGYNRNDELTMVDNNTELVDFIDNLRAAISEVQETMLVTYRALRTIAKNEKFLSVENSIKLALIKGENAESWKSVTTRLRSIMTDANHTNNKYLKSFINIVKAL